MTDANLVNEDGTENTEAPATGEAPTTTTDAPTVVLGQPVVYTSGKGKPKMALVIGTPGSIKPGSSLGYTLDAGEVTVQVFSPSGRQETKKKISFSAESAPRTWTATQPTE